MKIGLVGLPLTGKTTFFNLLTNAKSDDLSHSSGKMEATVGIAKVPDKRVDFLTEVYKPRKKTYATIEVIDIAGIVPGSGSGKKSAAAAFLDAVRKVDALVQVVRVFENDDVVPSRGAIDPMGDIDALNLELLFADLAIIENRISRIENQKKISKENQKELEVLKKCQEGLENGRLINNAGLSDEEKQYLRSFDFLTERPMILLVNLDEDQLQSGKYEQKEQVLEYAAKHNMPILEICAKTELEINQLEPGDRELFMQELGIEEPGISQLASTAYKYLGLISFLTAGEDEVRAWPVREGISAKEAAGKIHSDIERGFIRAEVVAFDDFYKLGTMQKVKEKGLFRLEGKEYVVKDGDIINFRFNV
ncbi:MAG TPA: redox-regulated ATPase YchF [Clostridiaceae bacterium]|jgi:GTP-binding protein YchF|nr:redox-regulated ATPase YchF [Clostridiaceae bacterium]